MTYFFNLIRNNKINILFLFFSYLLIFSSFWIKKTFGNHVYYAEVIYNLFVNIKGVKPDQSLKTWATSFASHDCILEPDRHWKKEVMAWSPSVIPSLCGCGRVCGSDGSHRLVLTLAYNYQFLPSSLNILSSYLIIISYHLLVSHHLYPFLLL